MRSPITENFFRKARMGLAVLATPLLGACATAPLTQSGLLSSYTNLKSSDGVLTKTKLRVDQRAAETARSVSFAPIMVAMSARQAGLSEPQLRLVANAIDRTLCADLSERYEVREPGQPADMTVRVVITHVGATDVMAAGASKVFDIGSTVAGAVVGTTIPSARLPLGLGGLSVEAEAITVEHQQIAAITWARGADMVTTNARLAEEADAYELASEFAADFSKLLVTGSDPIKDPLPTLPSAQKVNAYFGGQPKFAACEQFGRNPGLGDTIGSAIGLPPAWTDAGAAQGGPYE